MPGAPGQGARRGPRQSVGHRAGRWRPTFLPQRRWGLDGGSVSPYPPPPPRWIQALFPLLMADTLPQRKLDESCGLGGLATSG